MTAARPLVLASASPRRRELLARICPTFRVVPSEVEEALPARVTPDDVARLALAKARSVARGVGEALVLGADTVVVLEGEVLGKPGDPADAARALRRLRGRAHQVITGVAAVAGPDGPGLTTAVTALVLMDDYPDDLVEAYVASGAPLDKAGSYGIQDLDGRLVAGWIGPYSNIVGLPLAATRALLERLAGRPPCGSGSAAGAGA